MFTHKKTPHGIGLFPLHNNFNMSGFILNELLDKLTSRWSSRLESNSLELRVATADVKRRQVTYEYTVTDDEIFRGYLDSGWLSTVVDNASDPLICAISNDLQSYTSSLTVHTLEPVLAGARVEIVCRLVQMEPRMLQTTVVFRDIRKRGLVYATGVLTIMHKDVNNNTAVAKL